MTWGNWPLTLHTANRTLCDLTPIFRQQSLSGPEPCRIFNQKNKYMKQRIKNYGMFLNVYLINQCFKHLFLLCLYIQPHVGIRSRIKCEGLLNLRPEPLATRLSTSQSLCCCDFLSFFQVPSRLRLFPHHTRQFISPVETPTSFP